MFARLYCRGTLCASLSLLLLAMADAGAQHSIDFSFSNHRPGGEAVTAYITNQGRFQDVPGNSVREIHSPFDVSGYQHSTGYYDVRVTRQNQQTNVYCSYFVAAAYKGTEGWECSVEHRTTENGATCTGKRSQYWNRWQACVFDFDVK